jgi:hypothetical protein
VILTINDTTSYNKLLKTQLRVNGMGPNNFFDMTKTIMSNYFERNSMFYEYRRWLFPPIYITFPGRVRTWFVDFKPGFFITSKESVKINDTQTVGNWFYLHWKRICSDCTIDFYENYNIFLKRYKYEPQK